MELIIHQNPRNPVEQ